MEVFRHQRVWVRYRIPCDFLRRPVTFAYSSSPVSEALVSLGHDARRSYTNRARLFAEIANEIANEQQCQQRVQHDGEQIKTIEWLRFGWLVIGHGGK